MPTLHPSLGSRFLAAATHPVVGILGGIVAGSYADLTLLPPYSVLVGIGITGGAMLGLRWWLRLPLTALGALLGVGGGLTGLLFWLNATFSGAPVTRTYPVQHKHLRAQYPALMRSGEVSVTVLVGAKLLTIDLTRADTARIRQATRCDVSVRPGLLGVGVITQYRLRTK